MKIITGDITAIDDGIIIHQVNCQGVMGAGVAKSLRALYPRIFDEYKHALDTYGKQKMFGLVQNVPVTPTLTIVNAFTQFSYGNPKKTGVVYTDVNKLVTAIKFTCRKNPGTPVYIPFGIGAGFGGADWNDIASQLDDTDVIAVKLNR